MTLPKAFPVRPSLESLRKQAKQLKRATADRETHAIARARAQLPDAALPLSQRDAQLVLAREYGFAGWSDMTAEAMKRAGHGLEWARSQVERTIHDGELDGLKRLVIEYPALLSTDDALLSATASFGDSFDPFREEHFTRRACAEFLIDSGAPVTPAVWDGLIRARGRGMLQLLSAKGLLPRTLPMLVALGDEEGVRARVDAVDFAAVSAAFITASRFEHDAIAALLLERCIAFDPELGRRIDASIGRERFIKYFGEHPEQLGPASPWESFVMHEWLAAVEAGDGEGFVRLLHAEPWLLDERRVELQNKVIERATLLRDRGVFIERLFAASPAVLRHRPPPSSSAIVFAFEYGHAYLIPLLTRIWPVPDDLPHAAGRGDFDRVKRWFDTSGAPRLGNPGDHYPDGVKRSHLHWGPPTVQHVLDIAFAWACMNRHFDIAEFLLERGADVDTDWSTHEPASILHELVFHDNYPAMQFLIDHDIDMTTLGYRWNATAEGWAYHAAKDETKAKFLADAAAQRRT
jgi:hypothetical protein